MSRRRTEDDPSLLALWVAGWLGATTVLALLRILVWRPIRDWLR